MLLITGLGVNEYIETQDEMIVNLGHGLYTINGEDKRIYNNHNNNQFVLELGSVINSVTVTPKKLVSYKLDEDVIDVEEFNSRRSSIVSPYRDEEGYTSYPDLETEFEVRKQLSELDKYEKIYSEEIREEVPVELTFKGKVESTGSKYIDNALKLGKAVFANSKLYRVNVSAIINSEFYSFCKEREIEYQNDSNRSYLRFVKVGDNYVFTSSKYNFMVDNGKPTYVHLQSLNDAKEYEESMRSEFSNRPWTDT